MKAMDLEANPEEIEVPKEEAAVKTVRPLTGRYVDWDLYVGCN
jgi:hypothetical protein